jgi:DNA-binding response OmpR family regulator
MTVERAMQSPWVFGGTDSCLVKDGVRIELTETEQQIIDRFVSSHKRVLSKEEIVRSINKDPETYTGLEMCLSRLQLKFKKNTTGKRLIQSVRNRGYCLAQQIVAVD